MGYVLMSIAVLLLAGDFAINKIYQQKQGTSFKAGIQFNFFLGLFTAIVFFIISGFEIHFSLYSLLISFGICATGVLYNFLGFKILKSSGMSVYTIFLMNGGMIVPYVWGLFFFDESFSMLRTIGLVIMISAIILANCDKDKTDIKVLFICVTVFFLNGFVSVFSKMHQIENVFETVSATELVFYTGILKSILCGIILLLYSYKYKEKPIELPLKIVPIIVTSAVIGGVSYLLQLFGAMDLPATVLYPFLTGGSIIVSTLIGRLLFKEKITIKKALGVAMCFIGTCMFL